MKKVCDHKSVGILVWRDDKLLLIERKKPPFGFAPPAGHVDGDDTYEVAAKRELKEEVGLNTESIRLLLEGHKENSCRRKDGDWHHWKIYEIKAYGKLSKSEDEVKQANFYTKEEINDMVEKTNKYLHKETGEDDWQKSPGLEPVWQEWFKELKII